MIWQQNVTKILSELGWGSGFRLPISNAENVALERELEKKQRLVAERQAELDDVYKHTDILEKGIKSATDHIALENKLIRAKRGEIEAEKEFQKLSLRELQRTLRDYELTNTKFQEYQARNDDLCIDVDTRNRALSELVELIEYDRKELARLENISQDQDSYMQMLEELSNADAETLKKCEGRFKAAGEALAISRIELDKAISFTNVSQHQFEGLSERFRKLHDERRDIVEMWKNTLMALQSRDVDMKRIAEAYTKVHKALKAKDLEIDSVRVKVDDMKRETNSSDFELSRWDRKIGDIRMIIKDNQNLTDEYGDSAIAYETSITLGLQAIKDFKRKSEEINEELSGMLKKLAKAEAQRTELETRADITKMEALTASEKMKQISLMIEEEEKKMEELAKILEKEMARKSRWSTNKSLLTQKALEIDHEVNGASTKLRLIICECNEADIVLEKRKAMVYRTDIQFIAVDSKVKSLSNPRVFNPKHFELLEDKIAELKKLLQKQIHNRSFLTVQAGHLDDVNRRVYRERTIATKDYKHMEVLLPGCRVEIQFATKHLDGLEMELCDSLVEQSLVKLKRSQMLKSLKNHKSLLYDVGHQKVLLEMAVKEKRMEIEAHLKLLQVKRRGIRDEHMQYKTQLAQIVDTIYKKKNKYEIVMRMLEKPEYNGDGEIQSEAYYVLRLAQEREELRREGDRWDTLVKEAEKETEGLQNSLGLMQCSNELFKDSLKTIPDESYQCQMEELGRKQKDAISRKNKTMKHFRQLKNEIDIKFGDLKDAQDQMSAYANRLTEKDHEHRILQADLRNQMQTTRRVQNLTAKVLGEIVFSSQQEKDLFQLDIKLNATKRKLELALANLGKLVIQFPDIIGQVGIFMCEKLGNTFAIRFLKRINPAAVGMGDIRSGRSSPKSPSPAQFVKTLQSVIRSAGVNSPPVSATGKNRHTRFNTRTDSQQELIEKVIEAVNKQRQVVLEEKQMAEDREAEVSKLKKSLLAANAKTEINDKDSNGSTHSPKKSLETDSVWRPKLQFMATSVESISSSENINNPPPTPTLKTPANETVDEVEKLDKLKESYPEQPELIDTTAVVTVRTISGSRKQSSTPLPETESTTK